jgi:hypothetical protein
MGVWWLARRPRRPTLNDQLVKYSRCWIICAGTSSLWLSFWFLFGNESTNHRELIHDTYEQNYD